MNHVNSLFFLYPFFVAKFASSQFSNTEIVLVQMEI